MNIAHVGELEIDLAAWRVKRGSRVVKLAPLEFRLLACLAEHIGQVVSYDKLLDEVWGYAPDAGGTLEQRKLMPRCSMVLPSRVQVSSTSLRIPVHRV